MGSRLLLFLIIVLEPSQPVLRTHSEPRSAKLCHPGACYCLPLLLELLALPCLAGRPRSSFVLPVALQPLLG